MMKSLSKMATGGSNNVRRRQLIKFVDIDDIEAQLWDTDKTPEGAVEEFYRFGTLLFSEIQQRGGALDAKLTTMLGWSLATLAFLIFNQSKFAELWAKAAVCAAAILSFACVVLAAFALKTRMWPAPSEPDWFKSELWSNPSMLKRYHVVSLLTAHQTHTIYIKTKADLLGWIEILISISALALLNVLLFS